MSRMSLSTPCPPPLNTSSRQQSTLGRRSSSVYASFQDDTLTSKIDYTRAFPTEFKNARPRRKSTFPRKVDKESAATIFEDVLEDEELIVESKPIRNALEGKTLLGKRAQKMPVRKVSTISEKEEEPVRAISMSKPGPKKRESILPNTLFYESVVEKQPTTSTASREENIAQDNLKKNPRRRTIFVPEDTTVMSIHPGTYTTERLDDTFQVPTYNPHPDMENTTQWTDDAPKQPKPIAKPAAKRSRPSLAAMPPKRVALGHLRNMKATAISIDRVGQNGGKENTPPGMNLSDTVSDKKPMSSKPAARPFHHALSKRDVGANLSSGRKVQSDEEPASLGRTPSMPYLKRHSILPDRDQRDAPLQTLGVPRPNEKQPTLRSIKSSSNDLSAAASLRLQSSLDIPSKSTTLRASPDEVLRKSRVSLYPVLSEHVAQPELYEDDWISHQEVALTELVNNLFDSARPVPLMWSTHETTLRDRMLEIYHQPSVTIMYQRLQASLLYGALARPRESPLPSSLVRDLGLRKRFMGFWLDNYTEEALTTAAEVVFGRQLSVEPSTNNTNTLNASESLLGPSHGRRVLTRFLETFLVSVDDISNEHGSMAGDAEDQRWRKTIIRSLMLIWLLDHSKVSGAFQGCLFQTRSTKKNSAVMLLTLSSILLPATGDILRTLRNFDFVAGHVQNPLDEVTYRVQNIAVDLRDGVLLTRVVELLLSSSEHYSTSNDLSEQLKFPCLGRAQKLHNVQIALDALQRSPKATESLLPGIVAEDIVDGHREKTLSLMWDLISTLALTKLIDWREMNQSIRRLSAKTHHVNHIPCSLSEQEDLLQTWAASYAHQDDIQITNLTSSFANGRVYLSILNAFSSFLNPSATHKATTLEAHLFEPLNLSPSFVKHLLLCNSSSSSIPTRQTTLTRLAVLATRLLPLSRRYTAAVTLQRWTRQRQTRGVIAQRLQCVRVAHACATVVKTQERLVRAAVVLQRAWRRMKQERKEKEEKEVVGLQSLARGWLARSRMTMGEGRKGWERSGW